MEKENSWNQIISHKQPFSLGLKELLSFRDLLFLFVKRDLVALYKQTVLGPLWIILQPVVTTITFTFIFGRLAGLSTDGLPMFLFYFSGFFMWNFFAECLTKTSDTFVLNGELFSKVFFPRLIVPFSILVTNFVKLAVNFLLFIGVYIWFLANGTDLHTQYHLLVLFPVLIIIMAGLGLGIGLIISSMTTKYRDMRFLIQFGVQLLMYMSPIVYPLSLAKGTIKTVVSLNPMTHIIEAERYIFLGKGDFSWLGLLYSGAMMIVLLFIGLFVFKRVERSFIDTV